MKCGGGAAAVFLPPERLHQYLLVRKQFTVAGRRIKAMICRHVLSISGSKLWQRRRPQRNPANQSVSIKHSHQLW